MKKNISLCVCEHTPWWGKDICINWWKFNWLSEKGRRNNQIYPLNWLCRIMTDGRWRDADREVSLTPSASEPLTWVTLSWMKGRKLIYFFTLRWSMPGFDGIVLIYPSWWTNHQSAWFLGAMLSIFLFNSILFCAIGVKMLAILALTHQLSLHATQSIKQACNKWKCCPLTNGMGRQLYQFKS